MKRLMERMPRPIWLALALSLPGCTTVNTIETAQPAGQRQMVDDKRVLSDASLNSKARVVGVNQAITPGGLLRAQVEILNTRRSLQRINYRFEWFDQDGMQVNTPATATLHSIQIEGKESMMISSVAPTLACKDFRLKLIEGE